MITFIRRFACPDVTFSSRSHAYIGRDNKDKELQKGQNDSDRIQRENDGKIDD